VLFARLGSGWGLELGPVPPQPDRSAATEARLHDAEQRLTSVLAAPLVPPERCGHAARS
jgi:hypothetical protein